MKFHHTYRNHHKRENLYVYLNEKLVLTIKNIKKMATLSITVEDNQTDLDALKARVQPAADALTAAITELQAISAEFAAFQISFTVSTPTVS